MRKIRVLMLMAHTGGGHLRAAEAVAEALRRLRGDAISVDVVDALGDYAPFPFSRLARFYPWWIRRAVFTWKWAYKLTDGRRRAEVLLRIFWPVVWPRAQRLVRGYPADVIVSIHPLTNHYVVWTLRRLARAVPTVTLVTDPISVHPFWLCAEVDRCLVGSGEARRKALTCGCAPSQIRVTGLPVNPCFVDGLMDRQHARHVLGWQPELPAVLLVGGGDGMGRLYQTARAIDAICSGVQLALVAGRNQSLRVRLERTNWRLPTSVYGFVDHAREMPRLMSASNLLITKAGPGTLHEAFIAGLPLVLNDAVPGQEEGNVRLVVEAGAGVWAPDPDQVAACVVRWTGSDKGRLARLADGSRSLARPNAALDVAEEVWQLALTNL